MKIDTLTKNFSNYQTQINKDNDLVSNVHSDNVVKIQISDEARSLSQTKKTKIPFKVAKVAEIPH